MNKNKGRMVVVLLGLAMLTGTVLALSEGDSLLTKEYVLDVLEPQMETAVTQHIESYMQEGYDMGVVSLDELQNAQVELLELATVMTSSSIVPMDYGQGDIIRLSQGGSFLVTGGRLQMIHDGVVVDATTGEECPSGSYTTNGHRYIVAENTQCTFTVVSGIATMGYEGGYTYSSGSGKNHPFYDVYSYDSYNTAVTFVYNNGLFNGVGDGMFDPGGSMTRAMVMTVLYRLAGEPADQLAAATETFLDVADTAWYADCVRWGASQGVTHGVGDGMFDPDAGVTLVQMTQFLFNFGNNNLGMSLGGAADLTTVVGGDTVPDWGSEAAQWAVASGVWTSTLEDRNATRAEVAEMVAKFAEIYG